LIAPSAAAVDVTLAVAVALSVAVDVAVKRAHEKYAIQNGKKEGKSKITKNSCREAQAV